jgi:hypothetical protein
LELILRFVFHITRLLESELSATNLITWSYYAPFFSSLQGVRPLDSFRGYQTVQTSGLCSRSLANCFLPNKIMLCKSQSELYIPESCLIKGLFILCLFSQLFIYPLYIFFILFFILMLIAVNIKKTYELSLSYRHVQLINVYFLQLPEQNSSLYCLSTLGVLPSTFSGV